MKKLLLSIGLLMVAQGSFGFSGQAIIKERLLNQESLLDPSLVRFIQTVAKNASVDDLINGLEIQKELLDVIKSFTPEEVVILEKNYEKEIKKREEGMEKYKEELKKYEKERERWEKEEKEAQRLPKVFVTTRLSYPKIKIMRGEANDKILIDVFFDFADKQSAARLQAVRDLTTQEVDGLKKKYEQREAERAKQEVERAKQFDNSLLIVAQGSSESLVEVISKEAVLKGEFEVSPSFVRVVQAAKNVSDNDVQKALKGWRFVKDGIGIIKSLTPEEIVVLEKNYQAIMKKREEEMKKTQEENRIEDEKWEKEDEKWQKEREEAERSPKVFVTTRLSYPEIKIMRGEANDKILIDAFFDFGDKQSAARLQAVRDLTQQEVDSLKKKYEEKMAERAK